MVGGIIGHDQDRGPETVAIHREPDGGGLVVGQQFRCSILPGDIN